MKNKHFKFKLLHLFLLLSLCLFAYLQPFRICRVDGPSMSPTLKNGQFILMEKFNGDLKRDQIIILPDPDPVPTTNPNPSIKNIIKRIKFIPGDKYYLLQYYDNVDTSCQTSFIKSDLLNVKGANKDNSNIQQCFIYKGETFIEGDNKYLSSDSRSFGPIEIKDIKYVYVATL